ncbi:MAG: NUDIX domain-containing protein [Pseudomonadota bacterium]
MKFCPHCAAELTDAERGGRTRRVCPAAACGYVNWDNPAPVVAAVAERDGAVFLVRSHGWPESWYGLVTGFLEARETPEDAVLREVREELGLGAELGEYLGVYPFYRMNQLILAWHVKLEQGSVELDSTELAGYRAVPIERLRPWPAATGYALNDFLKRRGFNPEFVELGA